MDSAELRAVLAALAEFDVTEYEGPGGIRITRVLRPRDAIQAQPVEDEPQPVVIPIASYVDRAVRAAELDDLESELDRMGA